MRITIMLADPNHKLPDPSRDYRLVPADEPYEVESADPFWIAAIADGSVIDMGVQAVDETLHDETLHDETFHDENAETH